MELMALRRLLMTSLLILILFNFLITSSANAITTDSSIKVSPGQIPPDKHNDYLGNETTIVKLEYPKGMILQQTVGDLLFNITVKSPKRSVAVYIPPEFGVERNPSYVWSSITNDYRFISVSTLSSRDPIAPSWFRIQIRNGTSSINNGTHTSLLHHFIRLFNVTAPSIVGLYFFKVFVDGNSIGADNFPILVVSADPNPAYISGTVIDCRSNLFGYYNYSYGYYGGPLHLNCPDGGKVVAEGFTPDGRSVVGQAFFSASDDGQYTIYGLAAGTYNLTVYASGYLPTPMLRLIQVRHGQSMDGVDLCVYPCPVIEGIVMSKCSKMPIPWGFMANHSGRTEFGAALVYVKNIISGGGCEGGDLIFALRGGNTSDFLKYDPLSNQWRYMAPTPGPVGAGGSLAFNSENQYIYALQGGRSDALWAYDVANDQWKSEAIFQDNGAPAPVAEGGSIVFNAKDGYLYMLRGGGTTGFFKYLPGRNLTSIEATPDPVGAGGSLVFNEADGNIYALKGGNTKNFWRYNTHVIPPTWENRSSTPVAVSAGGSLTFNTQDKCIYAFAGDALGTFMKYDNVTDSWSSPAFVPSSVGVGPGGSLTFDTTNGLIYALVGGGSNSSFSYVSNTWSTLAELPDLYPRPITIEILDSIGNSMRLIQDFTDPSPLVYSYNFTYDGSTLLDGHIPQDGSGYIAGILLAPYNIRVYVNEYLQPQDMIVDLTNNPGGVRVVFDVERSGRADILLHFKDFAQGQVIPVEFPLRVSVGLYDRDAILRGQNYTFVEPGKNSANVIVTGFLGTLRDYGLPAGTYQVVVTADGFLQYYDFFLTISDCALTSASLDVIKTGSLLLSVRSVNSQSPAQPQNWLYPDANIRVEILDQYQGLVYKTSSSRQRPSTSTADFFITGLRAGTYIIHVYTFGYFQKNISIVDMADGITSDMTLDVVIGGAVDVSVLLFKEDLPIHANETYPFSSTRVPFRVELYDSQDQFVAANATYIPANATTFSLRLNGFRDYAGNPALRWVNYYDATDGAFRTEYGLPPGSYWAVAYLPGFSQGKTIEMVTVLPGGRSSIVLDLNRLAHLSGEVTSLNMFGESVTLNWAIVDAIGSATKDFAPTLDGHYDMWLEEGGYLLFASLRGYETSTMQTSLSKGSNQQINFKLTPIGFNIPEFKALGYLPLILAVVFAVTYVGRSRHQKSKTLDQMTLTAHPLKQKTPMLSKMDLCNLDS